MKENKRDIKEILKETKEREERLAKEKFNEEQRRIRAKMYMVRG